MPTLTLEQMNELDILVRMLDPEPSEFRRTLFSIALIRVALVHAGTGIVIRAPWDPGPNANLNSEQLERLATPFRIVHHPIVLPASEVQGDSSGPAGPRSLWERLEEP